VRTSDEVPVVVVGKGLSLLFDSCLGRIDVFAQFVGNKRHQTRAANVHLYTLSLCRDTRFVTAFSVRRGIHLRKGKAAT
jgi:hypothetical protein